MKKLYTYTIGILFLSVFLSQGIAAHTPAKKDRAYLKVYYMNHIGEYKMIDIELKTRVDGEFLPIEGATLDILFENDGEKEKITDVITDSDGLAKFMIEDGFQLPLNEDDEFIIHVEYPGNESYRDASKKIKAYDIQFNAVFDEETKNVHVFAEQKMANGETTPVEELEVDLTVKRMYSRLPISVIEISDGEGEAKFPSDIIGDENGELTIYLSADDRDFEQIEFVKKMNWGIPVKDNDTEETSFAGASYLIFMVISIVFLMIFGIVFTKLKKQ